MFRAYDVRGYAAMAGLGFLGIFLYSGLYYHGLSQLTSQEACILNYLWPMMIVLFSALLLGEKVTVRTAAALLLSFSGVVVLTLGGEGHAEGDTLLGTAACVTAALCYGLFCVLNKRQNMDQTVMMVMAWGGDGTVLPARDTHHGGVDGTLMDAVGRSALARDIH